MRVWPRRALCTAAPTLLFLSCTFARTQTVVEIRADARVSHEADEVLLEVRDANSVQIFSRSFFPQSTEFRGFPLEIPISARKGEDARSFQVRVSAISQRRDPDGTILTTPLAENRVRTGFQRGQVLRFTLWLLSGCRCNVETERCEPDADGDLVPECLPQTIEVVAEDARVEALDAVVDGGVNDPLTDGGANDAMSMCGDGQRICAGRCVAANALEACGPGCSVCEAIPGSVATCSEDQCGIACNAGTPNRCSSACVNFAVDAMNCGRCGNVCATGQLCVSSQCQAPPQCTQVQDPVCTGMSYCNLATRLCTPGCDGRSGQCANTHACDLATHSCTCGAPNRMCSNVCATCPNDANATGLMCSGTRCVLSDCEEGYELSSQNTRCVDINECSIDNGDCGPDATCTNTPGDWTCTPIATGLRWRSISTTMATGTEGHAMTFDTVRQRLIVFGGSQGSGPVNDVWELINDAWTDVGPMGGAASDYPAARIYHAVVFDTQRRETVVFGGRSFSQNVLGDTWVWTGTAWVSRHPPQAPPARYGHTLSYDSVRGRVVLFGGYDGAMVRNDTWEWDGTTWQPQNPVHAPPARMTHAAVYDAARQRTVVFGGSNNPVDWTAGRLGDLWVWDGVDWQNAATAGPQARHSHAMAYDAGRQRTVLFGGRGSGNARLADTWQWTGAAWEQLALTPSPSRRSDTAMAYDTQSGAVLLFGGNNQPGSHPESDLWRLAVQ